MIQFTGYFRNEEDLSKWRAIPNKTEWLHNALNPTIIDGGERQKEFIEYNKKYHKPLKTPKIMLSHMQSGPITAETPPNHTIIKTPKDAEKTMLKKSLFGIGMNPKSFGGNLCKIHGTPLTDQGKCLQKGCRYS